MPRKPRNDKAKEARAGQRAYILTEDEKDEARRIRRLNIANGVQHLVRERNKEK